MINHKPKITLYIIIGVHLAVIQYAYFFLLEAYLSSRSVSYFICLFFWLCGFLVGLNLTRKNIFLPLVALGWLSYEISYVMHEFFPYQNFLYFLIAATIALSGLQSGYFFRRVSNSKMQIQKVLLHENNGFVLGTLFCMLAVLYYGHAFLAYAPTVLTGVTLFAIYRWDSKV